MKTEQTLIVGLGVVVVAIAFLYELGFIMPKERGCEITPGCLKRGLDLPPLWIFYNDSEVNSRHWADFGSRSSNALNIPLLNLCYKTIANMNGLDYRIEVISGLAGVRELLGIDLPDCLRNPKARISFAEEDWIRTAILAKYGGLWVSPSIICLKGFGKLCKKTIIAFGQDDEPIYGSSVPGFRVLWVPVAQHPTMIMWEERCRDRLDNQLGGKQIRSDSKSDWIEFVAGDAQVKRVEELGRDPKTNKKLQLEDLFAVGEPSFTIPEEAIYLVIPLNELLTRRAFGWVLMNSEAQIEESDLVINNILMKSQ